MCVGPRPTEKDRPQYFEVSIRELDSRSSYVAPQRNTTVRPREKFLWDCYQQFAALFAPLGHDDNLILMRRSELDKLLKEKT